MAEPKVPRIQRVAAREKESDEEDGEGRREGGKEGRKERKKEDETERTLERNAEDVIPSQATLFRREGAAISVGNPMVIARVIPRGKGQGRRF